MPRETVHRQSSKLLVMRVSCLGRGTGASEFPHVSGVRATITSRLFQLNCVIGTSLMNQRLSEGLAIRKADLS